MNKVILMGHIARGPEIQTTTTGKVKALMTLAVDRPKAKDGTKQADFIGLIAWEKTAEFADKYLSKGQRILVEGRIQTGSYEKDGEKRYTTDVVCERIEFADSKGGGRKEDDGGEYARQEDIPF